MLDAAFATVPAFGVATECGLGRRPPQTIPDVMKLTAAHAFAAAHGENHGGRTDIRHHGLSPELGSGNK